MTACLGVLDRRMRACCREAKARHATDCREQLEAHDHRAAWEHCSLLAGHSCRSVKPRAVPPEKALDPVELAPHLKKVFGATPRECSAVAFSESSSRHGAHPLSDHFAGLPAHRKQALKMKNGKSTTTWSVPAELHKFYLSRADPHNDAISVSASIPRDSDGSNFISSCDTKITLMHSEAIVANGPADPLCSL